MPGRGWSQQDRDEYSQACAEAWASADSTGDRGRRLNELVADAVQAHRPWAVDLLRQFCERGAQAELKSWRKTTFPLTAVSHDGRVLSKTRVVGVERQDDDGARYVTQALFDLMSFAEIEQKIRDYQSQVRAYGDNIDVARRLLKLRDLVPEAETPAEAVSRLGTTVDAWLMEAAS